MNEEIVLSAADAEALVLMMGERGRLSASAGASFNDLLELLQTAYIAVSGSMPQDRVTMNSRVSYVDHASGEARALVLAWPNAAAPESGRVSVLSPMGSALLGRRVGARVSVELPRGAVRSLTITGVDAQGEAFLAAPA